MMRLCRMCTGEDAASATNYPRIVWLPARHLGFPAANRPDASEQIDDHVVTKGIRSVRTAYFVTEMSASAGGAGGGWTCTITGCSSL